MLRVCIISDTYGNLPDIKEEFDIFIHAGNFCPILEQEAFTWNIMNQVDWVSGVFNPWLKKIKCDNIIVMPGQTDYIASYHGRDLHYLLAASYIQDDTVSCCGYNIYGMPWIYKDHIKQSKNVNIFNYSSRELLDNAVEHIPEDTDILISRMSPYGILDLVNKKNIGNLKLLNRIGKLHSLQLMAIGGVGTSCGDSVDSPNIKYMSCSYSVKSPYCIAEI